jgi:hypothetical protein
VPARSIRKGAAVEAQAAPPSFCFSPFGCASRAATYLAKLNVAV